MNKYLQISALALSAALGATAHAADIVVIGNASAAPLSKEQVSDTFLGKNPSLVPVDQLETAPIRAEFYKKATGRDQAQIKALWSRLVFSGKAQPPKEVADSAAVKKAVAADPKAIGYIEKGAVDGSVKVLSAVE
jgi:ABC-type phosphate transport system substrate-binding protein